MNNLVLFLRPPAENAVTLPRRVNSHREFVRAMRRIRAPLVRASRARPGGDFIAKVYYLLGFMVGDGIKHCGSRARLTMDFQLQLTKKHRENVELGDYVAGCLQAIGLRCVRGPDGAPRKKVPNGYFYWRSDYSPVIGWLFTACLGLGWDERTTRSPLRMDWLLCAPRKYRIWFVRGLADSDGDVHFQHRRVDIATTPNTAFVSRLLESLGLRTRIERHNKGHGYVNISYLDAAKIGIFNPRLLTHRRVMLEKLASARVFKSKWPDWLASKVRRLIAQGLDDRGVADMVLGEDNVYARMRTIKKIRGSLAPSPLMRSSLSQR